MCDLTDLTDASCGTNNAAGTEVDLYLVPREEITTFPDTKAVTDPGGPGATPLPGEEMIYVDNIVLDAVIANKGYFRKYSLVVDKNEVASKLSGEIGSMSWENGLKGFIAGSSPEMLQEIRNWARCSCGLVALIGLRDGKVVGLGKPTRPLFLIAAEIKTGLKAGDPHGGDFEFKATDGEPFYEYRGAIDRTPTPD
jgi:hypothetical protein